ncbi:MAG: SMP-30/gluconolactonase/LRE family protein [Thaumarchaeota archaeon]|nr:SMP-30/gluconolactonase/LRE family protein [Candidatus Nitrosotalea sp.]MDE1872034.1 SMP-30/gluconolactonase/LRE family protein [Nitrososphaerota archaeon]
MKKIQILILITISVIVASTFMYVSTMKPQHSTTTNIEQANKNENQSQNPTTGTQPIVLSSDRASAGDIIKISAKGFLPSMPVTITLPGNSVVDITTEPGTYMSTFGISGRFGTDNSHLSYPEGVALDKSENIYVVDRGNSRIQKFSSSGEYKLTLGVSGQSGTDNSHFNTPISVALDTSGNIYVADTYNHRIQKFSSDGKYLSTLGVSGEYGLDNNHFSYPEGVALDTSGNIYVADTYNHRIQKFSSDGTYLFTLGIPGEFGTDNAHFCYPASVALDRSGNIYVVDSANNRIQEFSSDGKFMTTLDIKGKTASDNSTYTKMSNLRYSSAEKAASDNSHFATPQSMAFDSSGNIYVADTYNHRIQEFSSDGTYLSTLGVSGMYGTDNGHFGFPTSVTLDKSGNIYVADFDNNRVQKFSPVGSFEKYITIPSAPIGDYTISVTDGQHLASSKFSLVSPGAANPTIPIAEQYENTSKTPAAFMLYHGISIKDAMQKSKGPVNASNTFAFFLLSNIAQKDKGDIFFSPYSISDAFSMAYEGARGQTENEIKSVFGFADRQTQRESIKGLDSKINRPDAGYSLNIANALWVDIHFPILDNYSQSLQKYYSAKSENLDFQKDTEGSRQIINKWVENKTAHKIMDLLPKEYHPPDADIALILTNAIYFKGTWMNKFDESKTHDEDFTLSNNSTVKVPMMYANTGFGYLEDENLKILSMPYSVSNTTLANTGNAIKTETGNMIITGPGEPYNIGGLSMMIILPKEKSSGNLADVLSADKFNKWRDNLRMNEVSVHLPKFTLHTSYKLKKNLSEMGMPSAFDCEMADFSGIDGYKTSCDYGNLYIDQVYHKAFVDVDEKGTEAAAATAIVMTQAVMGGGIPPLEFNADHPFVFIIYDNHTGLILFAGQMEDPSSK